MKKLKARVATHFRGYSIAAGDEITKEQLMNVDDQHLEAMKTAGIFVDADKYDAEVAQAATADAAPVEERKEIEQGLAHDLAEAAVAEGDLTEEEAQEVEAEAGVTSTSKKKKR